MSQCFTQETLIETKSSYLVNECEMLIVDSHIEVLKPTPLEVANLRGQNTFKREYTLNYCIFPLHWHYGFRVVHIDNV